MDQDLQTKAKKYSKQKYILTILEIVYSAGLIVLFLSLGISRGIADFLRNVIKNNFVVICVYVFFVTFTYSILSFPINLYRSFILEHKFNLSAQSFKNWFGDFLKSLIISCLLFLILTEAFYFILHRFPYFWWLVVAVFWILFSVVLTKLTPVLIIPLFFKYKTVADVALKERIRKLAAKMGIKILDVYQIDFSKKTHKANAGFVGIGRTRRVILADTLKDKYNDDEIEVILAHEFAHYRQKHLIKLILINSFFIFVLLYLIFKSSNFVLNAFKLGSLSDIANLPIILFYTIIFNVILAPFVNAISRKFEREADSLSIKFTGAREAFVSVMQKLAQQNLADTSPNKWIKWFFFDHPPIQERIKMAEG
ncbi:MAG: M48 family metallopeptidase [Candidatus Omnitrophica bacterium]|nr:M48 family metallopeptidase [Candidatus Omnitrophota bacterium]MCM8771064.1 M48 family metallopeptidase [Candidatus Omnitrophota bacterium]